ncbi:dCTP deaminase [Camelliibacillus cellulosilyticus]|uniref:dCTP deaminase n=1 Tax=Camelliibacillus cellulosilyticus TaxID=2174486 RepID=A0ABV9GJS9_9BACL
MSMLSDRDLIKVIREKDVVLPFLVENCKGATIDLTLDPMVKRYKADDPIILGQEMTDNQYEKISLDRVDFWLAPNETVLIQTNEYIKVPNDKTARIYERYSIKSLGLLVSPAHYINPGYRGKISLTLTNHSSVPVKLTPGIKICQFGLFELTSLPLAPYEKQNAKYMDAKNVSISRLHLDKEIQDFLKNQGVKKVSDQLAHDLGEHLMSRIKKAAKELADFAKKEYKPRNP